MSNLSFVSKIIEKVVSTRLEDHLRRNGLHEDFQSAYRSGHSTETALLCIHSDILNSLDKGEAAILVLLDLSAAFDTIYHQILLARLNNMYGISGTALNRMKIMNVKSITDVSIDYYRQCSLRSRTTWFWCSKGLCTWTKKVLYVHKATCCHHPSAWTSIALLCRQCTALH